MIKKLSLFTGITFFIYFAGDILGYLFFKNSFLWFYLPLTLFFVVSNFWYYYMVVVGPTTKTNNEYTDLVQKNKYDFTRDYGIPEFCFAVGKFINTIVGFARLIFNELITNATKTSVFNAKFNFELKNITHHMNETKDNLEAINKTMNDSTKAIGDISNNMEKFVRFMEEVNAISSQTINTTQNISKASQNSIAVLNENKQSMDNLHAQIDDILSIVNIINDIANQTNLLALNAAIEAARAGEHGRGFAVVADEIRKLAEKTQKATDEVASIIKSIQEKTTKVVKVMNQTQADTQEKANSIAQTQNSVQIVSDKIANVSDQVNSLSAATQELSSTVSELEMQVKEISKAQEENAKSVETISANAQNLKNISDGLLSTVGKFKT